MEQPKAGPEGATPGIGGRQLIRPRQMPASRADFLWEEEGEDHLVILVVRADLTLQASLGDQVNPQDRRTGSAGFRLLFLCHPYQLTSAWPQA